MYWRGITNPVHKKIIDRYEKKNNKSFGKWNNCYNFVHTKQLMK
jgi:hypothetical protein